MGLLLPGITVLFNQTNQGITLSHLSSYKQLRPHISTGNHFFSHILFTVDNDDDD